MTRDEFCKCFWDYYMILEKDFLSTERYITFELGDNNFYNSSVPTDFGNSMVFSVEFIKQYQAICAEIDVMLKSICKELGKPNDDNMLKYTDTILSDTRWQNIINQKVKMKDTEVQPFSNWTLTPYNAPDWWPLYNDVKHKRIDNIRQANLKNVINSLAGLYVFGHYFVKYIADLTGDLNTIDVPNENSKLFEMTNWQTVWRVTGKDEYLIPDHKISEMFE